MGGRSGPADRAPHTPVFDYDPIPGALALSHRTTVRADLRVQAGNVRSTSISKGTTPGAGVWKRVRLR